MKTKILRYCLGILVLLILWKLISLSISFAFGFWETEGTLIQRLIQLHTNPHPRSSIFPGPFRAFYSLFANFGEMLVHFGWSAFRVLTGLLIALFLAVPLGLAIGFGKRANDYISPLIYTIYPIPMVAFLPVFFVLIGIGEATRITLIVLVVFFQILLSARDAAKNVPQSYIISVLAAGGNKRQIYRHVIIPASMPAVLSGARISVGWAIIVMYLTEVFYTNVGLGYYITSSWQVFNFVDMFVGIMGIAILGMMLYAILDATERVVCRWKYV